MRARAHDDVRRRSARQVHRRGRDDRGCDAFAGFSCPAAPGARFNTWWLWQRILYACGAAPRARGRLGAMLAETAWNATAVTDREFPVTEDKNWSPFPSRAARDARRPPSTVPSTGRARARAGTARRA